MSSMSAVGPWQTVKHVRDVTVSASPLVQRRSAITAVSSGLEVWTAEQWHMANEPFFFGKNDYCGHLTRDLWDMLILCFLAVCHG